MKRFALVVLACAGAACKIDVQLPDAGGSVSSLPPAINTDLFAKVGGNKLLADVGNARLELDPTQHDALTALAECADLVSYCYAPGSVTVSECFGRARKCTTTMPWMEAACCPEACKSSFDAEVAGGMGHVAALEKVLFREPDCFPGVRAALGTP